MSRLAHTRHSERRFQQRGLRNEDVDLILRFGVAVLDGYILLEKDSMEAARVLRAEASRLEQLKGARLVSRDGVIVTGYRATRRQRKELARGAQGTLAY